MEWKMILQFVEKNKLYIGFFLAFMVVYIAVLIILHNRRKASNNKFLAENPDAAKVFLQHRLGMSSDILTVCTVNGENPRIFRERGKTGIYILPGRAELSLEFQHQRHTGMRKTVIESTGLLKKTIETEARGQYSLRFDRKASAFILEKV